MEWDEGKHSRPLHNYPAFRQLLLTRDRTSTRCSQLARKTWVFAAIASGIHHPVVQLICVHFSFILSGQRNTTYYKATTLTESHTGPSLPWLTVTSCGKWDSWSQVTYRQIGQMIRHNKRWFMAAFSHIPAHGVDSECKLSVLSWPSLFLHGYCLKT